VQHSLVQIGVGEDDVRRLAAQFIDSEIIGAFQGMMQAITPNGSGTTYSKCSAGQDAVTDPSILSA
jgi:hypothetical protein